MIIMTACTRSQWLLSFLYNRIDNQVISQLNDYAEFSDAQKQRIRDEVKRFHYWHRRVIMPEYARILGDVAGRLRTPPHQVSEDIVEVWVDRVLLTFDRGDECGPLADAGGFFSTLTDTQIDQIEEKLKQDIQDAKKFVEKSNDEKRIKLRFKWARRFGLQLTETQKQVFRESFNQHIDLRSKSINLHEKWNHDFTAILRGEDSEDKAAVLQSRIDELGYLVRNHYRKEYQANRKLWENYLKDLLNGLNLKQRSEFLDWLDVMQRNVEVIAKDDVEPPANVPFSGACGVSV